jgi:hypothetical protein
MNQIIEGTINNLFNKQESLFNKRIKICEKCKLYIDHPTFGPLCNNRLFINPITDEISNTKKEGFKKGCGCILRSKTRVVNAKCPINK